MRIDLDSPLVMGGRLLLSANAELLHNAESRTVRTDEQPALSLTASCPTSWERNVARLGGRVKDVQTLIQEDLREIDEPLTTLGTVASTLSQEHVKQWEAAKAAYSQAMLECTQVLERMLSPFTEIRESQEQRRD
jgi:hypothetical protein